jgi:hypothetical protein
MRKIKLFPNGIPCSEWQKEDRWHNTLFYTDLDGNPQINMRVLGMTAYMDIDDDKHRAIINEEN